MAKRPFLKPATTYDQQIALLEQRGMEIEDRDEAKFYLQHLNYYRLGAYWLPFESDHATHTFRPGTRFRAVLGLYVFDRELRLLALDAIERVEVSVRSQWAYQLAHYHGPHAHLNLQLARQPDLWRDSVEQLRGEVERSREVFLVHLRDTYSEELPPIWACCEVLTLGQLSKWFDNLKPGDAKTAIASVYGLKDVMLVSWLRHLTQLRNVSAHHNRLWNREFAVKPMIPKTRPAQLVGQLNGGSAGVYNALAILAYLLDRISPGHTWRSRLHALLVEHGIDVTLLGFPAGWAQLPLWHGTQS